MFEVFWFAGVLFLGGGGGGSTVGERLGVHAYKYRECYLLI